MQQFRVSLTGEGRYRFVIHDRDAIYSEDVDRLLKATGLEILKTPAHSPQAIAVKVLPAAWARSFLIWREVTFA